jgi:hypothetical protein
VHLELEGFLLAKKGISNIKPKKFICSTCYVYIENNKIPKFALANGLWIGIAPKMLIKLTMVEELQDFKGRKLSSRFCGFGGGPIICQFIGGWRTLFLSCCLTHDCLHGVAYNLCWGFAISFANNSQKVIKFFVDNSFRMLVK